MMNKIDILLEICAKQPSAQAFYMLAMAQVEEGKIDEAREAMTQAIPLADSEFLPKLMELISQITLKEPGDAVSAASGTDRSFSGEPADKGMVAGQDDGERKDGCEADRGMDSIEEQSASQADRGLKLVWGGKSENNVEDIDEYRRQKTVTFADVGGLDNVKTLINMKIIQPFLHPELFAKFGKKAGGGVLLFGPPGCGKTYIAKATAGECQAQFINVSITDILNKWLGESERNMENIFIRARSQKPSIVFMDEIDMLGYSRIKAGDTLRGVVDHLLSEMERTDSNNDGILIIGATNMPWDVDTALKRPGRFDKTIFVPPPDAKTRAMIFGLRLKDKPVDEVDPDVLSRRSELFSGADIASVVEQATETVLEDIMHTGKERLITQKDLLTAIGKTRPSTLEWLKTISDYVRYSNQAGLYTEVEEYLKEYRGSI